MLVIAGRKRRVLLSGLAVAAGIAILVGWERAYVEWRLHVARTALNQARVKEALSALEAAEELAPSHPEVLFLLGRACRRDGQTERAVVYLEQAGEVGWSPKSLRHQRSLLLVQRGQFELAGSYLDEVFRTRVDDALAYEVYEAMVKGYLTTYRIRDAVLCLDHFIAWQPDAVEPRLWRADIWSRLHYWERAREEYERIVQLDPECHAAWAGLGDSLLQLNHVREALQAYERSLQIRPDAPAAILGRAKCNLQLGRPEEAAAELQRLASEPLRDEIRAEVVLALAEVALERKEHEQALVHLKEAKKIDPGSAPIHYSLGRTLARLGRAEDARREFARAETLRKLSSRFGEISQDLVDQPHDPDLRWEAGRILMDQGYEEAGAAWMATALAFDPQHQKTHESLAVYYAEHNQPELAAHHQRFLKDSGRNGPNEFVQVDGK